MSTKLQRQKRITKQVRVDVSWHKILKVEAAQREITTSKLLDEICRHYFELCRNREENLPIITIE